MSTISNGSVTETVIYNALGQRIRRSGGAAGTVLYAHDEAGHVLGEYDGTGALVEETVWLGDIPVASLRPRTGGGVDIFYVHTDQLNTPRAVTRASDNMLMWSWFSDPFGTDAANENPAGAGTFTYNLRLPGQVFGGPAGLHYNYLRDYDPALGRYAESDPIGLKGGINTYTHVSNPLSETDRFGLMGRAPGAPGMPRVESRFCGSGWNFEFVPEDYLSIVSFSSACKKHDDCYSRCGANKGTCDLGLLNDMRSACMAAYSANKLPLGLAGCMNRANLYYPAVSNFGQGAFNEAQKSCKCTRQ